MRVSQLVERSGFPLATIKYYLREGLLAPGEATSATQAQYGEEHVRRLALIRALIDVAGLSVTKTKVVLNLIDSSPENYFEALNCAMSTLPPYTKKDGKVDDEEQTKDYPRARAAIEKLGWGYNPSCPAVNQLERALAAAESVGIPVDEKMLLGYGNSLHTIAQIDITRVHFDDPPEAARHAVLGATFYEPVLIAMRRLAHIHVAAGLISQASNRSISPDR